MKRLLTIIRLALADYRADVLLSACSVLSLAAAMLPLLVILGVQQGLIGSMTGRLLSDPRNLEIRPAGMGQFSIPWIEEMRANPEVSFIIPQTRSISAQLELFPAGDQPGRATKVDLLPSGQGDPLLTRWEGQTGGGPTNRDSVILSSSAARKLGAEKPGEEIRARVSRRINGVYEQEYFPLTVQGILPLEADQRDAAYADLSLLEDVEVYRDGRAVDYYKWKGDPLPAQRQVFTSFRLYARDLDGVEKLNGLLLENGIETYTRAEEISSVKSLDKAFTFMGLLLIIAVGGGFLASAVSSSLAQVGRKQRSLGVLRLLGFTSKHLALFPVVQAFVTGALGAVFSLGLFYALQGIINRAFAAQVLPGDKVCNLSVEYAAAAVLAACAIMVAGSLAAGRKISGLEPSALIREI